jgi:2-dehydro-3-deoxygalactonokinase
MNGSPHPALIGLDWGTSALRAYLLGPAGEMLERRAAAHGILQLPQGGYAAAFLGIAGDWLERWPSLPVVAAGMVGSRNGWHEAPYLACPVDVLGVAKGLVAFDSGCGLLHLVPGLSTDGPRPDVIRGEEMQVLGGLTLEPKLTSSAVCVLPGTHCKWVTVREGLVTGFTTYLSGEVFALLRDHSLLGQPAREAGLATPTDAWDRTVFSRGIETVRDGGAIGIAPSLFSTRSLFLRGDLTAAQTLDHLSGLIIGEEIRSAVAALAGAACSPLVLLGDPSLCERYRVALACFGIDDVRVLNETGPFGLWRTAMAAGLVPENHP